MGASPRPLDRTTRPHIKTGVILQTVYHVAAHRDQHLSGDACVRAVFSQWPGEMAESSGTHLCQAGLWNIQNGERRVASSAALLGNLVAHHRRVAADAHAAVGDGWLLGRPSSMPTGVRASSWYPSRLASAMTSSSPFVSAKITPSATTRFCSAVQSSLSSFQNRRPSRKSVQCGKPARRITIRLAAGRHRFVGSGANGMLYSGQTGRELSALEYDAK